MSKWIQIFQEEDADWIEWHKEVMSERLGRVILKIWLDSNGSFKASMTKPNGLRVRRFLGDLKIGINKAKEKALEFAGCK